MTSGHKSSPSSNSTSFKNRQHFSIAKKGTVAIMAAILAFSLASCGDNKAVKGKGGAGATDANPQAQELASSKAAEADDVPAVREVFPADGGTWEDKKKEGAPAGSGEGEDEEEGEIESDRGVPEDPGMDVPACEGAECFKLGWQMYDRGSSNFNADVAQALFAHGCDGGDLPSCLMDANFVKLDGYDDALPIDNLPNGEDLVKLRIPAKVMQVNSERKYNDLWRACDAGSADGCAEYGYNVYMDTNAKMGERPFDPAPALKALETAKKKGSLRLPFYYQKVYEEELGKLMGKLNGLYTTGGKDSKEAKDVQAKMAQIRDDMDVVMREYCLATKDKLICQHYLMHSWLPTSADFIGKDTKANVKAYVKVFAMLGKQSGFGRWKIADNVLAPIIYPGTGKLLEDSEKKLILDTVSELCDKYWNSEACYRKANMMGRGIGYPRNTFEARMMLIDQCEDGHLKSCKILGANMDKDYDKWLWAAPETYFLLLEDPSGRENYKEPQLKANCEAGNGYACYGLLAEEPRRSDMAGTRDEYVQKMKKACEKGFKPACEFTKYDEELGRNFLAYDDKEETLKISKNFCLRRTNFANCFDYLNFFKHYNSDDWNSLEEVASKLCSRGEVAFCTVSNNLRVFNFAKDANWLDDFRAGKLYDPWGVHEDKELEWVVPFIYFTPKDFKNPLEPKG